MITDHHRETLRPLSEPERARHLLTGLVGPLYDLQAEGFSLVQAGMAYLIWQARRRARAHRGMLSGRPGYEADQTLQGRVFDAADCSAGLKDFGSHMFRGLNLELSQLPARDLLWWHTFVGQVSRDIDWYAVTDRSSITEILTAVSLLVDWMHQIDKEEAA